jgi:hypothetical protein
LGLAISQGRALSPSAQIFLENVDDPKADPVEVFAHFHYFDKLIFKHHQ